jgi:hypothetical protein
VTVVTWRSSVLGARSFSQRSICAFRCLWSETGSPEGFRRYLLVGPDSAEGPVAGKVHLLPVRATDLRQVGVEVDGLPGDDGDVDALAVRCAPVFLAVVGDDGLGFQFHLSESCRSW